MDPPVKPEGDAGGVGARHGSVSPRSLASASFAGSTGESIAVQRTGGNMDPPVEPEGGGIGGAPSGGVGRGFRQQREQGVRTVGAAQFLAHGLVAQQARDAGQRF